MGWGEGSGYSAVNDLTIADKKIRWFVGLRSNIIVRTEYTIREDVC
jgi:hypothetical protein